ncbi:hypothetical protein [Streptomyces sp. NPDC057545]
MRERRIVVLPPPLAVQTRTCGNSAPSRAGRSMRISASSSEKFFGT